MKSTSRSGQLSLAGLFVLLSLSSPALSRALDQSAVQQLSVRAESIPLEQFNDLVKRSAAGFEPSELASKSGVRMRKRANDEFELAPEQQPQRPPLNREGGSYNSRFVEHVDDAVPPMNNINDRQIADQRSDVDALNERYGELSRIPVDYEYPVSEADDDENRPAAAGRPSLLERIRNRFRGNTRSAAPGLQQEGPQQEEPQAQPTKDQFTPEQLTQLTSYYRESARALQAGDEVRYQNIEAAIREMGSEYNSQNFEQAGVYNRPLNYAEDGVDGTEPTTPRLRKLRAQYRATLRSPESPQRDTRLGDLMHDIDQERRNPGAIIDPELEVHRDLRERLKTDKRFKGVTSHPNDLVETRQGASLLTQAHDVIAEYERDHAPEIRDLDDVQKKFQDENAKREAQGKKPKKFSNKVLSNRQQYYVNLKALLEHPTVNISPEQKMQTLQLMISHFESLQGEPDVTEQHEADRNVRSTRKETKEYVARGKQNRKDTRKDNKKAVTAAKDKRKAAKKAVKDAKKKLKLDDKDEKKYLKSRKKQAAEQNRNARKVANRPNLSDKARNFGKKLSPKKAYKNGKKAVANGLRRGRNYALGKLQLAGERAGGSLSAAQERAAARESALKPGAQVPSEGGPPHPGKPAGAGPGPVASPGTVAGRTPVAGGRP